MKKKIVSVMLATMMVFSLVACGSTGNGGSTQNNSNTENTQSTQEEKPSTITIQSLNEKRELMVVLFSHFTS